MPRPPTLAHRPYPAATHRDWQRKATRLLVSAGCAGALGFVLALAWPAGSQAKAHPSQAVAQAPWWTRFDDPALSALVASGAGDSRREAHLARGYITWRVLQVRGALARQLLASAERELMLVRRGAEDTPGAVDSSNEARWRRDRAGLLVQELALQQQQTLAALATMHGSDADQLGQLLVPNLLAEGTAATRLPAVHAGLPPAGDADDPQQSALANAVADAKANGALACAWVPLLQRRGSPG